MSKAPEEGAGAPRSAGAARTSGWTTADDAAEQSRARAWLSQDLAALIQSFARTPHAGATYDYDFVIVGSGYGGAIALSTIAGKLGPDGPVRVCLLERGSEYLPGSFPSRLTDLAGHIRYSTPDLRKARGTREGLFDIRIGKDVSAVVASALGGGSLINAGVMALPDAAVLADAAWPRAIRDDAGLVALATDVRTRLGAVPAPAKHRKHAALQSLDPAHFRPVDITVADKSGVNAYGVHQNACIACGDCATGCNHQAKTSLDVTLLVEGRRRGAEIYTGATVLDIVRLGRAPGWTLHVVHTTAHARRRQQEPLALRARHVILCAGTFGSTELLLRSQTDKLRFSQRLGHQFSANGDALGVAYDTRDEVNAVVNEGTGYTARQVGPTISGMVDLRAGDRAGDLVIQDLGVPGPLRRAFEELFTTANAIYDLEEADATWYQAGRQGVDRNAVDVKVIRRCLPVAIIGRDSAQGRLALLPPSAGVGPNDRPGGCEDLPGDGAIGVTWPALRDDPEFERRYAKLDALLASSLRGRLLRNPMWRLLPPRVSTVLGEVKGALLTVHPLGGCPMGDDAASGVVDHLGRVFDAGGAAPGAVHDGLYVLDGAIVPTSLGINPSLTIATLAQRAASALCVGEWQLRDAEPKDHESRARAFDADMLPRPIFREPPPARAPADTLLEFTEQIRGKLALEGLGDKPLRVEITCWFKAIPASRLFAPGAAMELDAERSELRIYDGPDWPVLPTSEGNPLLRAKLAGSLRLFRHEPSFQLQRTLRGAVAWAVNRGLRDIFQYEFESWAGRPDPGGGGAGIGERVRLVGKLASRAGDRRLLEYDLRIHRVVDPAGVDRKRWEGQPIRGEKCVTYSRAGNPLVQLMRTRLTQFPRWRPAGGSADVLEVNLPYFGWVGVPLVHIAKQEDEPTALVDLTSMWMYVVRTLLPLHTWTLRKPDPAVSREPSRLPGPIRGIAPEVVEFAVAPPLADGTPVVARLTRYRAQASSALPPVLAIHGYSASGTTFAHPAVPSEGLAGYLCARSGRDVWVLDLRSSAGMRTATEPWAFEDMGYADIPLAVDHVVNATGAAKIDVVAHCMGVAMLSMGLMGEFGLPEPFPAQRGAMRQRLRRLVMSQVAPMGLVLTPSNLLRAYVMRYLMSYLRVDTFRFRPEPPIGKGQELVDRLLALVPYPDAREFRRENPLWPPGARTPWVGARHRMDALYGVTFKLANMSPAVLDHIDDFFGPLSFQTVSQVIHFAQHTVITDRAGDGSFVNRGSIEAAFGTLPVLHVQGTDNGLVHIDTQKRFEYAFSGLAPIEIKPFEEMGHQDSLIGTRAEEVFAAIDGFLAA